MTARDFVKYMEEIINSPGQRLIGNPTTGYVYLDADKAKQALNELFGIPTKMFIPAIKKVHFNNPVTVVLWTDGTKTIVRCGEKDIFDPEKGLAMAIVKKALGNKGNYYETFKKWLPEEEDAEDDISEESYEEKDTKCDLCEHKEECVLLECTHSSDERTHYIPAMGNICKKERLSVLPGLPYTVKEYCELHDCTKNKVYGMIKRGEIRAEKDSKGFWIVYE